MATDREPIGRLALLGGGAHAMVVAESAVAAGIPLAGFLDDDEDSQIGGLAPRLGPLADFERLGAAGHPLIIAIGDVGLRGWLVRRLKSPGATVVHPSAVVSITARIGAGVFIGPNAVVNARARVGEHAILNTGCIVEHDCTVGVNSHVAPGAALGGAASVGDATLIGLGSRLLPGARVGSRSVVGAGAVVTHIVGDDATVFGVPAREKKKTSF